MYKNCSYVLFIALALLGIGRASAATPKPLGTNLVFLSDWSIYMLSDAFKQSRPWITSSWTTWDTHETDQLDLDEDGWVRSLPAANDASVTYRHVTTLMFTDMQGQYPAGEYVVLYDGEGQLSYGRDALLIHSQPGRDVLDVTPNSGILLRVIETNPDNYLRNIRILMPGISENDPSIFHPDFLDSHAIYDTIRFTDWQRINWDLDGPIDRGQISAENVPATNDRATQAIPSTDWADRSLPSNAIYTTSRGVPVEVMVDLVNELGSNAWFNMPHIADDTYMTQFAQLVHDQLDHDQTVYVEYSNEIWNYGFAQGTWIEEQAKVDPSIGEGSDFQKRLSWYGKRSGEMCDIWQSVWGVDADRVVCVIGGQAANTWVSQQILDCPLWEGAPCYDRPNTALAVAPYFGQHIGRPEYQSEVRLWLDDADGGLDKLFEELEFGTVLSDKSADYVFKTDLPQVIIDIQASKILADDRNIQLVTYESGQHLAGIGGVQNDQDIHQLFADANTDPRMGTLYCQLITAWDEHGGGLFTHYLSVTLYSKWGYYGAADSYHDTDAPKRDVLELYANTGQCAVPTAITLSASQVATSMFGLWLAAIVTILSVWVWYLRRKHQA